MVSVTRLVSPAQQPEPMTLREALFTSRTGTAYGFDEELWGRKLPSKDGFLPHVAEATIYGYKRTYFSQTENNLFYQLLKEAHSVDPTGGRDVNRDWHGWHPWEAVPRYTRDYLASLLWVPDDPEHPLFLLAKAADG